MPSGTTDNVAASVTEGAAQPSTSGNISSGTASEAMIKAAMAASSADTPAEGQAGAADTAGADGAGSTVSTGDAQVAQPPTGQPDATGTRGEAPQSRIEAAVKNAREKAVAETEARYEAFKGVDPDSARIAFGVTQEMVRDPQAFASRLAGELGMRLVPLADSGTKEQVEEQLPEPGLRAEDGTRAYSAEQVAKILDIREKRLMAQIDGRVKPLLDDRESSQRAAAQAEVRQAAQQTATSALETARKLPHFQTDDGKGGKKDNPKILANLIAIPAAERTRIGAVAAMYRAYNQFLVEDVFPTIDTAAEARVRDSFNKKAATSAGSGHPTSNGGDGKAAPLNTVNDLARHMERMAAAQTA